MPRGADTVARASSVDSGPGTLACQAMVLAAGFGTRLGPLTELVPKPLVPYGDRTVLAEIVSRLRRAGVQRVAVNAHHRAEQLVRACDGLELPIRVRIEPAILGTAGGVQGVRSWLDCPVLVWNGDILATPPVEELLGSARETGSACLAVALRAHGEGSVGLDARRNVVRLRGERFGIEASGADYVGIAALGERCLARLPDQGCLVADVWLPQLREGEQIVAKDVAGEWFDFGSLRSYLQGNFSWLVGRGTDEFLGTGSQVAPGVDLRHSVVGAGATLTGIGRIEDSVVWPGAALEAPARAVIALPDGRVVSVSGAGTDEAGGA